MISNFELDDIAKELKIPEYKGAISKGELKPKSKDGYYIVNLDDGAGTHWTLLELRKKAMSHYFDPFGVIYPVEVKKVAKNIDYTKRQVEDLDSSLCGYYCLFVLILRAKYGIPFKEGVKIFYTYPQTALNSKIIDKCFGIKSF